MSLARAIVALDGVAERMLLLPTGLDPQAQARLLTDCDVCDLITDMPVPNSYVPKGVSVKPWHSDAPAGEQSVETQWVLATSGTTGCPKLVQHSLASLTRLTNRDARAGSRQRWGLLYELSRFAGLQVALQAIVGGSSLVLTQHDAHLTERLKQLIAQGCTCLSATPTMWRKILMSSLSRDLRLKQITLGGEIADDATLKALRTRFPDARIVHIYASTEAGAAFSVTDGRSGFPAEYLETAPKGVELRVVDGRLSIRNPLVKPDYLGSHESFSDEQGFVDTGDSVRAEGDRIYFEGRSSGCINVGGNKVHPEEVETVMLECEHVLMVKVTGRASSITGQLVTADVVLDDQAVDVKAIKKEIMAHCTARLEPYKRPALIRVVDSLDVTAAGKIARASA